jgi:hypothetical protein
MTARQFDELIDEIIDEKNDRSLVILCTSIIDDQLYDILSKFLQKPSKKDDDLLKGDNPLSTFSSRIKIIYRLKIIDNSLREILDQVRKIRNLCAHSVSINLNKSPIKDHILYLKKEMILRYSYKLTKERYFENKISIENEVKAIFVSICVILKAINESIDTIIENEKTIKISKK